MDNHMQGIDLVRLEDKSLGDGADSSSSSSACEDRPIMADPSPPSIPQLRSNRRPQTTARQIHLLDLHILQSRRRILLYSPRV